MRGFNVEKEEFWGYVLSEHAQSGLSISEFCRREGVSQASFYQWRKKLATATTTAKSTACPPTDMPPLIPVEVVPQSPTQRIAGRDADRSQPPNHFNSSASLTIRTPQGYVIEVSNGTSADILECSLGALQQLAGEASS